MYSYHCVSQQFSSQFHKINNFDLCHRYSSWYDLQTSELKAMVGQTKSQWNFISFWFFIFYINYKFCFLSFTLAVNTISSSMSSLAWVSLLLVCVWYMVWVVSFFWGGVMQCGMYVLWTRPNQMVIIIAYLKFG